MTYGELKDRVLQLIFSYSIAGEKIELSYNNQEDYVTMIPGLLNACQTEIYQVKKIYDAIKLEDLDHEEEVDGTIMYHLPDDCLKVKPGLLIPRGRQYGPVFERFNGYKLFGGDKMLCPAGLPSNTLIEYQKRGLPVPPEVQDNYVLRNPDEVNELLPFYIAAFVVVFDDPFRYSVFYNEFETRLARLELTPTYVEHNEITDVYSGFYGGFYDGYYGGW